jgi:hypothetical protein
MWWVSWLLSYFTTLIQLQKLRGIQNDNVIAVAVGHVYNLPSSFYSYEYLSSLVGNMSLNTSEPKSCCHIHSYAPVLELALTFVEHVISSCSFVTVSFVKVWRGNCDSVWELIIVSCEEVGSRRTLQPMYLALTYFAPVGREVSFSILLT